MIQQLLSAIQVSKARSESGDSAPPMGQEFAEILDSTELLREAASKDPETVTIVPDSPLMVLHPPLITAESRSLDFDLAKNAVPETDQAQPDGELEDTLPALALPDPTVQLQPMPSQTASIVAVEEPLLDGIDEPQRDLKAHRDQGIEPDVPLKDQLLPVDSRAMGQDTPGPDELTEKLPPPTETKSVETATATPERSMEQGITIASISPKTVEVQTSQPLFSRSDSIWLTRPKLDLSQAQDGVPIPSIIPAESVPDEPIVNENASKVFVTFSAEFPEVEKDQSRPDLMSANVENLRHSAHPLAVESRSLGPLPVAPPLPAEITSQLVQMSRMPNAEGVEVLLNPEELGKVRFEIHQTHDTIRIVLTAERTETMEMLRRHSDQLLQEFRQSGFNGTSLSFGKWGQQEKSGRPAAAYKAEESLPLDLSSPAARDIAYPIYAIGQGLNLRL